MATQTNGFRFDLNRAIQAAGVVLRDYGPMDRMRLLKILYIASRKALQSTGKPIIGGRASALQNGPLHSEVYSQIKGDANDMEWRTFFKNTGHTIQLIQDPSRLDLSPLEIDELIATAKWAEQFETFQLSQWTHENLEEYKKNQPEVGSARPISINDMLEALGFDEKDAQHVIAEQRSHDAFIASLESSS